MRLLASGLNKAQGDILASGARISSMREKLGKACIKGLDHDGRDFRFGGKFDW